VVCGLFRCQPQQRQQQQQQACSKCFAFTTIRTELRVCFQQGKPAAATAPCWSVDGQESAAATVAGRVVVLLLFYKTKSALCSRVAVNVAVGSWLAVDERMMSPSYVELWTTLLQTAVASQA
jgi:hypothetical protein